MPPQSRTSTIRQTGVAFAIADVGVILGSPVVTQADMRIRYSLERLDSDGPRRDLTPGTWRIGRDADNHIVLDAQGVSRVHAEIVVCGDRGVVIRDLGSTNGTRVDGERIAEYATCGDVDLVIGNARLRLRERQCGLDELAYATESGGRDASTAVAPSAPTASVDLTRELRAIAARLRPDGGWTPATLSLLFESWAGRLGIERIALVDVEGLVCAACGPSTESGLVDLASQGDWRIRCDPLPASAARALATVAEDLLVFAPLPVASTESPDASAVDRAPVDWPGLPSASPAMREVLRQLDRAACSIIPVLLLGETGVGKDLIARWLHRRSERAQGPFLALNCAALPKDLLEAELFGVEKGAATGVAERPGLLEQADGGTIFLDEVGDTALETQARLLRVLEDGRITRVGGRRTLTVDVRLIAATNRDLDAEIAAGRFRLDLYHRLAGFAARVPPLRERREDIAPLAIHFYRQALERAKRRSTGITAAALLALQRWPWPGNVRELRQAIERAVIVLDDGEALDQMHLPEPMRASAPQATSVRLDEVVLAAEREAIVTALALAGGAHEAAWSLLGIGKSSFYKRLKLHGLGRSHGDGDGV